MVLCDIIIIIIVISENHLHSVVLTLDFTGLRDEVTGVALFRYIFFISLAMMSWNQPVII